MLFASVDSVLRWAYAMEGRSVVARSSVFASGANRSPRLWDDWTTWERHAQAAMVRAQVERQERPLDAYAIAMYARFECRFPAAQQLVKWAAPEYVGTGLEGAYELMVEQYVLGSARLRGGGIGPIRYELGCRKTAALDERRRIFGLLDGLRSRLFDSLTPPLSEGGLIAGNA